MKLVLLRHGLSAWNKSNRFTGWTEVPLAPEGIKEAYEAGKAIKDAGLAFDHLFTSLHKRAHQTSKAVLSTIGQKVPETRAWQLNERHYGALQGLNKAEMTLKYGEKQVHAWRRGYAVRPPALKRSDPRFKQQLKDFPSVPLSRQPLTESLKDTVARVLPYWKEQIAPRILAGERIIISAHGNSLRALVKHLDKVPSSQITEYNIPTGVPLVYELDGKLRPLKHYYLGDPASIAAKIEAVKNQAKAKK